MQKLQKSLKIPKCLKTPKSLKNSIFSGNLFNIANEAKSFTQTQNGVLPSLPQKLPKNHRLNLYLQYKLNFIPEIIFGEDSPLCFIEFFNYLKYLPYGQIPDYRFLKSLFKNYLKSIKFEVLKFKYDWVQVMLNENVDLGDLSQSLTKANSNAQFGLKKERSINRSESEQPSLNPIEINSASAEPEEFKLKLESSQNFAENANFTKKRSSFMKFKNNGPLINGNLNGNINGNINGLIVNGNMNGNMNGNINGLIVTGNINGNINGMINGFYGNSENFNEISLNEGKRLSEQKIGKFE